MAFLFWLPSRVFVVNYFLQNNPVDGDAREVALETFQGENFTLREYQTEASTVLNDLHQRRDLCLKFRFTENHFSAETRGVQRFLVTAALEKKISVSL